VLVRHHSPRRGARVPVLLAVLATLVCILLAFAIPALASAAEIKVTTTEDEADLTGGTGGCETAAAKCSLRAAIETSNENPATPPNEITFETPGVFGGAKPVSTITLLSALPEIEVPVDIDSGECPTALVEGPCAEVDGTSVAGLESVFQVVANGTTISHLAIEGGENGIVVGAGRTGFKATGDWFGVELTTLGGSEGGSENAGIYLNQGADNATIGGDVPADRNDFGRGRVGVVVRGASNTSIQGNYFGVNPNGSTFFAELEVGIQVGDDDATGSTAENTEIGGEVTSGGVCDGTCNVIATFNGGAGIELTGTASEHIGAATGPTTISGNYIGLGPDGTTTVGSYEYGIFGAPQVNGSSTLGPGEVTIGGVGSTEANYIVGGETGIEMEGAGGLQVDDNEIGYTAGLAQTDTPSEVAIRLVSHGVTEGAVVFGNRVNAEGANGIENEFAGAEIYGNEILEASRGVMVKAPSEGIGNKIFANNLVESGIGIWVDNDANEILGNTVTKTRRFGIYLEENADHNVIGGDEAAAENTISGTGNVGENEAGAIVITGFPTSRNEVRSNVGTENQERFIQLAKVENSQPTEPNGGIEPPTLTSAQSIASGTGAKPDATVRVFTKASTEEGELKAEIGKATADSAGNWTVTFQEKVPVRTLIAATQTSSDGGTSEVSAPVSAAADPVEPEQEKQGGGGTSGGPPGSGSPNPAAAKPTTPTVKITKGPKKSSKSTTAKFKFAATPAAGATFECKLDGKKWAKCKPPKTYKGLKPGKHTFQVRASVPGAPASKPAKSQFTVKS
jgi:CSLREA domain-containing protein